VLDTGVVKMLPTGKHGVGDFGDMQPPGVLDFMLQGVIGAQHVPSFVLFVRSARSPLPS
jgi:hypothetical protein